MPPISPQPQTSSPQNRNVIILLPLVQKKAEGAHRAARTGKLTELFEGRHEEVGVPQAPAILWLVGVVASQVVRGPTPPPAQGLPPAPRPAPWVRPQTEPPASGRGGWGQAPHKGALGLGSQERGKLRREVRCLQTVCEQRACASRGRWLGSPGRGGRLSTAPARDAGPWAGPLG